MGFFGKSKADAHRTLSQGNNRNSGKKLNSRRVIQLKESSSTDDDLSIPNGSATAGILVGGGTVVAADTAPKWKSPMKSKFWRLQEENADEGNTVEYVPPPGTQILVPNEQKPFVDRNVRDKEPQKGHQLPHVGATKKQYMTFKRLDSMDDVSATQRGEQEANGKRKNQTSSSKTFLRLDDGVEDGSMMHSTTTSVKYGSVASTSTAETGSASSRARLRPPPGSKATVHVPVQSTRGNTVSGSKSTKLQAKDSKQHLSSAKKKTNVRPNLQAVDSIDSISTGTYGEYQPPPSFGLTTTSVEQQWVPKGHTSDDKQRAPITAPKDSHNSFLMEVIRHSTSDETFDVRTERSRDHQRAMLTGMASHGSLKRSDSGLHSYSGLYSEASQSGIHSESSISEAAAAAQEEGIHDFRQIMFDNKVATVTKSDAGSSDFSDFVKAASNLTRNLNNPQKQPTTKASSSGTDRRHVSSSRSAPVDALWADGIKRDQGNAHKSRPYNYDAMRSKIAQNAEQPRSNTNHPPIPRPAAKPFIDNAFMLKWNQQSGNRTGAESLHDDCGASVSSNQSSQKSRHDFQVAMRTKLRTPVSDPKVRRRSQKSVMTAKTGSDVESMAPSAVSEANATFSNATTTATNHFAKTVAPASNNHHDPFLAASDFSVTIFGTDDVDPFNIGGPLLAASSSGDSTWDVNANPFPDWNSSKPSSKPVAKQISTPQLQVAKAASMDDGLIAAIRSASAKIVRPLDPGVEESKRDPSPRAVQPSRSDSVLEYKRPKKGYGAATHKHPPKAVPSNAILGSMLFRQTESIHSSDDNVNSKESVLPRKSSRMDDDNETRDERCKVPRAVDADDGDDSIVSSVTEEASSFYNKSFGGNSAHWNKQAQNVLNHYNVKRTLQSRDTNSYGKVQRSQFLLNSQLAYESRPPPPWPPTMTRVEEEHANMFRSEA
jgi:hypothetical protein